MQLPSYGFDFQPFDLIRQNEVNDVYLIDVIGKLTAMSDPVDVSNDGTPNYKLIIELEDSSENKLTCTLWGKYAQQLLDYRKGEISGHPIIVLQFAKIKKFRDQVSLSNSLFATKILINGDITEVHDFKESIRDEDDSNSQVIN
ncbi:Replication protein A 70 kDa DNA-binding subunit A [Bienertia sinuspersici]